MFLSVGNLLKYRNEPRFQRDFDFSGIDGRANSILDSYIHLTKYATWLNYVCLFIACFIMHELTEGRGNRHNVLLCDISSSKHNFLTSVIIQWFWGQCRSLHVGVPGYRPP